MKYIKDDFAKKLSENTYPYSFVFMNGEGSEEQYRNIVMNFLSEIVNNQTLLPFNWTQSGLRSIFELRSYATGKQPVGKYQSYLCGAHRGGRNNGKPKVSMMNISWDVPAFMPKMLRIAKNLALSTPFAPDVEAIDPKSKLKKQYEIAFQKMLMDDRMKVFDKMLSEAGADPMPKQQFENEYELAVHNNLIGLKTETEVSYQNLLTATDIWSDKDEVLKGVAKDLVEIGIGVKLAYTEESTGKVKYKYVDPDEFAIDYSEKPDCSDSMRAGHFELMSLSEIQREAGIEDIDELMSLASKNTTSYYAGYNLGNIATTMGRREMYFKEAGNMPLDDIRVPVFNMAFVAYDDIDGNLVAYNHKVKMVMNTNYIFGFGKDDTPRDKSKEEPVSLPYKVYRLDTSMTEACIGLIDDVCLATFKKRNALAKAIPSPAIMINKKMLESVEMGGQTMQPVEVVEAMFQTGVGYFDPVDDFGKPSSGNYSSGVIPIPQTLSQDLMVFNSEIVTNLQMIEKILGINEFVDASTPSPRQAVSIAEMSRQSTLISLKDITDGVMHLYEQTMDDCMRRWQIQAIKGNREIFAPLGDNTYNTISLTKDMAICQLGLYVKVQPNDAEINQLLATITQLRDARQANGQGGISAVQYLMVYKLLRQRKYDEAVLLLDKMQKQNQQEDMERSMQLQQQNAQIQMQSSAAATEGKVLEEAAATKREVTVQKEKNKGALEKAFFEKTLERQNLQDELTVEMLMNRIQGQEEEGAMQPPMPTQPLEQQTQNIPQ